MEDFVTLLFVIGVSIQALIGIVVLLIGCLYLVAELEWRLKGYIKMRREIVQYLHQKRDFELWLSERNREEESHDH